LTSSLGAGTSFNYYIPHTDGLSFWNLVTATYSGMFASANVVSYRMYLTENGGSGTSEFDTNHCNATLIEPSS